MNTKSKLYISCLLILTLFCSTIFSACSVITSENLSSSNENLSNSSSNNSITNSSSSNNDSSQHSESSTTSNSNTSTNSSSSNSDVSNTNTPSSEPIKKVTITFNSNGGTNCDSITQEVGSALTLPQPTKTDYDFVGWYTQNEINENYLFESKVMPNEDITLYAGWELQDNIYMNDYLSAKNFEEWKSTSTYDVDDYIVIRYFSDEVDVTCKSQYNLNTGINVLQDGYILNWYKDKDFKDNLATQKDYLKYGDNVYFATITTSSGQFVSAYAVNIYVYHDYTYTYYEYQPGYKLASKMKAYGTQKVSESKTYEALKEPKNGYTFKGWVTSDNKLFDFSKPIGVTDNLKLYATYEDVELNIDGDKITYSPYLTTNLPIKESTEGHFFDGYYSNGVQYFDENGNAITPLPFEATKTIEYGYSEYTQEKYFEFSKVDGGYSVSLKEMPLYTTTISIPKEYNNELIIAIDENAFENFNEITKIIIPNCVTSIGERAFYDCSSLKSITIPTSVTSIEQYAFRGCSSLESIEIPFVGATLNGSSNTHFGYIFGASGDYANSDYVPKTLKEVIITGGNIIGEYAFRGCSSLKSIVIPTSVTSIGKSAFYGCNSLERIEIPTSVTSIGYAAFSRCSSLVIYCEASSKLSDWDSDWNYSNRPVYWGINENNFKEENGFQYVIEDGKAILTRYVGNETTIEIPNTIQINGATYNVTSIGNSAFEYCSSLERIEIPNSVKSIGECAFSNCSSLESISIPTSVTSIEQYAFFECNSLESITIPFVGATLNGSFNTHFGYIFGASSYNENSTYVPSTLKEVLITGGNSIESYAFYNCSSLKSIEIPNRVTSIGKRAFYGCSSLIIYCEASSEPSGWNRDWNAYDYPVYWEINENNYKEENGLQYVIQYGNAILTRYVGNETTIEIPNTVQINGTTYNVTSIGWSAFSRCSSLESIEIPNSVTSIGSNAFYGCYSLVIYCEASSKPSGWNSKWNYSDRPVYWGINENNYKEENGLQYVIHDGEAILTNYVENETSVEIPNTIQINGTIYSVTSIGNFAFYGCSSLERIEIPNSVTSIGGFAFEGCSSLERIEIPNSVTSIGQDAFQYCSSLIIYCEASSEPSGWSSYWNYSNRPVYWKNQWHYDENGNPVQN